MSSLSTRGVTVDAAVDATDAADGAVEAGAVSDHGTDRSGLSAMVLRSTGAEPAGPRYLLRVVLRPWKAG